MSEDFSDPYHQHRFRVDIQGITKAGFAEVHIPESQIDIIEYWEGGKSMPVTRLSGKVQHENVILKWGITDNSELSDWWSLVQKEGCTPHKKDVCIILMDDAGNDKIKWLFTNAWPIKYHASDLNALESGVCLEMVEITFDRMQRFPVKASRK